jgi:hypothetical protein
MADVGYKFSLVLSREITEDESVALKEAGCTSAVFATDSLPTNAEITVTKMDFDDSASPSLAEAIEAALEAVKAVPELTVPGLMVPAQPAEGQPAEAASAQGAQPEAAEAAADKPAAKKAAPKKATAKKSVAKEAGVVEADAAAEPV